MPECVTIENPEVVFADTVEAVAPSLFVELLPPAFQFQATAVPPFGLTSLSVPKVKPSDWIDFTYWALLVSTPFVDDLSW